MQEQRHALLSAHSRPRLSQRIAVGTIALSLALLSSTLAPPPSVAQSWKDCAFNDQPIRCRDSHSADGTVRIVWEDGKSMTYRVVEEGFPISVLRDSLGGVWEREVFVQGNAMFTNPANGNRIFVPLR